MPTNQPYASHEEIETYMAQLPKESDAFDGIDDKNKIPETIGVLAQELPDGANVVTKAVMDGVELFEAAHGRKPHVGVIETAVRGAYASLTTAGRKAHGFPAVMGYSSLSHPIKL